MTDPHEPSEDRELEEATPPEVAWAEAETEAPSPAATPVETTPGIPWRLGLFLALTITVVVFAVQNTQDVELKFLGWIWQLPLVIVILIFVVVAVVLDEALGGIIKRRRAQRRREREELKRLRQDS